MVKKNIQLINSESLFQTFRDNLLCVDPVFFAENYLTLDGQPFRLNGNGYKPFADIYRYIGIKAIEPNAKPIILVKGRQVGATTMAAALEAYFTTCGMFGNNNRPPMRLMHLFPTMALASAYTKDKLDPIVNGAKPEPGAIKANGLLKSYVEARLDTSSPANNNMFFKKFLGGNQIWIESSGPDGDRVRGRTVDCAFFDEVQDMPRIAIGAVTKILAQAKYGFTGKGIQVYFGTPKQKNTVYYEMWKLSSQQYFHLHCESCNEFFPLYHPEVNWEDIWLYGFIVKCTHCEHEQDKRIAADNGKWIPFNTDENVEYVGYHINQLYMPTFTKETILSQKPERNPANTERIYMNEVLGEFYAGEGGTISADEIQEICGDPDRTFVNAISKDAGVRVYAGFDWGQRGDWDQLAGKQKGQSYSCGVILTAQGPKLFNIEFATRLQSTSPEYKEQTVDEMFRRYSVHLGVGDIGDSGDLSHRLQKKYNERFLVSRAVPKINSHIKFDKDIFPKEIKFERDYYISEVIGLLKEGAIRFPYGSYERLRWLVDHCCSMEIKIGTQRSGDPVRRFVKGSIPNDGFMALLNAYLAWKYDVTQGFSIKQPQWMKYDIATKKRRIPAVVGYVPRFR